MKLFILILSFITTGLPLSSAVAGSQNSITQIEAPLLERPTEKFHWTTGTASSRKKEGVVVVFLSAKCPCSDSHLSELRELAQIHPEFDFAAVHSNRDEDLELSRPYFKEAKLGFPVLEDSDGQIAELFGAYKTPHSFVVLKNGEIAYRGGVSNSQDLHRASEKFLRSALADLRTGEVKIKEGRTLGCVISRGENHVW